MDSNKTNSGQEEGAKKGAKEKEKEKEGILSPNNALDTKNKIF